MREDGNTSAIPVGLSGRPFNPNEHLTDLRGGKYLEVRYRIIWFRQDHPSGIITTELVEHDRENKYAVVRATVSVTGGGMATGYSLTEPTSIAKDYIANAETSAIGRALAHLGYGTVNALEMDQGDETLADSPVQRKQPPAPQPAPQRPLQQAPPPEPMGWVDTVAPSTLPTGGRLGTKAIGQWLARARAQFPDAGTVEAIARDLAGVPPEHMTIVQAREVMEAIEGGLLRIDGDGRYVAAGPVWDEATPADDEVQA